MPPTLFLFFETGSCYITQIGLELKILLPLECWNGGMSHPAWQNASFYLTGFFCGKKGKKERKISDTI
jgi:hypothetical protein